MIDLQPGDDIYKNIIREFRLIGEPLHTNGYINTDSGEIVDAIIPDDEEYYNQVYNSNLEGVLNYIHLPNTFEVSNNLLNTRGL